MFSKEIKNDFQKYILDEVTSSPQKKLNSGKLSTIEKVLNLLKTKSKRQRIEKQDLCIVMEELELDQWKEIFQMYAQKQQEKINKKNETKISDEQQKLKRSNQEMNVDFLNLFCQISKRPLVNSVEDINSPLINEFNKEIKDLKKKFMEYQEERDKIQGVLSNVKHSLHQQPTKETNRCSNGDIIFAFFQKPTTKQQNLLAKSQLSCLSSTNCGPAVSIEHQNYLNPYQDGHQIQIQQSVSQKITNLNQSINDNNNQFFNVYSQDDVISTDYSQKSSLLFTSFLHPQKPEEYQMEEEIYQQLPYEQQENQNQNQNQNLFLDNTIYINNVSLTNVQQLDNQQVNQNLDGHSIINSLLDSNVYFNEQQNTDINNNQDDKNNFTENFEDLNDLQFNFYEPSYSNVNEFPEKQENINFEQEGNYYFISKLCNNVDYDLFSDKNNPLNKSN